MSAPLHVECRGVGKVFRSRRRREGGRGLLGFFRRDAVELTALAGVDLAIRPGELVGLIGANGAGKTTLVKCLTGIVPVSAGSARLFGHDAFHLTDAHKRRLSLVMGQRSQLWWDIPAVDSFRLLREIYQVEGSAFDARLRSLAERLGVEGHLATQLRQLSLGERMKMEIIGAFLHDPDVVFLDEPTIGLDLVSQETIRRFLRELNQERGATIVLTSHDMADIEQTCHRLLILDRGRMLFDGDIVDLQRRLFAKRSVEVHLAPGAPGWGPALEAEVAAFGASLVGEGPLRLCFEVPAERSHALVQRLFELLPVRDLGVEHQPLEHLVREVFRTSELEGP